MEIIKPTPSQAAVALKKFFARQNIDIKLSLAQEAIAVTNGYPSWNVLCADIPTRAVKAVPEAGAQMLGPEGFELWAVTCRVQGDDDDSLYLEWGATQGDAVAAANRGLMDDSGIEEMPSGDLEDEGSTTIFNINSELVGVIRQGKFCLEARMLPPAAQSESTGGAGDASPSTEPALGGKVVILQDDSSAYNDLLAAEKERLQEQLAPLFGAPHQRQLLDELTANVDGPTLANLVTLDSTLTLQGNVDEEDRLEVIRAVMAATADATGLLRHWHRRPGRDAVGRDGDNPLVQVSYDMIHGQRYGTEIILALRYSKLTAYVRTWEFLDNRQPSKNYRLFDEESGDFDTDVTVEMPDVPVPGPRFSALIQDALKEAAKHRRMLLDRLGYVGYP